MVTYNIKFPLTDDSVVNTFFKMTRTTKDAFSSNLLLLLLTEKGERYYEPDFGTNLVRYVFEQNDNITSLDIEKEIKKTVGKYIPSLTIEKIEFNWDESEENQLNVKIKFTYTEDAFTEAGELDLKF